MAFTGVQQYAWCWTPTEEKPMNRSSFDDVLLASGPLLPAQQSVAERSE